MENFDIRPYCYEEDQTHKSLFGYNECAYCGTTLCMYCDGTIPAVGKYCSMRTGLAFPVCTSHKKTIEEASDPEDKMFFDRF